MYSQKQFYLNFLLAVIISATSSIIVIKESAISLDGIEGKLMLAILILAIIVAYLFSFLMYYFFFEKRQIKLDLARARLGMLKKKH